MPTRAVQQVIVAVVAIVGLILGVLAVGVRAIGSLSASWLKVYSISVSTVGLLFLAHDRWLWKFGVLRFGRPLLEGTWRGRLSSTYKSSDGEEFKDLQVHLLVRQTFGTTSATLMSERSESESTLCTLRRRDDGRWHVGWAYLNVPRPSERGVSEPHHGACDVIVGGVRGERLQGRYFTDRKSDGELIFDQWSPTLYGDAKSASEGNDYIEHPALD